ncbi:metallophosphoesterase family protein [Desulfonatronovibrio magnus]|uniref:metallophosphoesterase family protein n=1 Tax=Desulfonatronovibrio magnus TaxID=698827 RepID=UPI0005EBE65F|nr:DNA repair exonuclease [Desulfonatronovibrio magnus]
MLTFIHAADFHLDSPLRGLGRYEGAPVADIREASRRALAGLVDYILENKIPLLLIAGDLYDDDCPDFQTLLHVSMQMDKIKEAGTRVAFIKGNHDAGNSMTRSLKLPDNVKTFSTSQAGTWIIEELGVAVHGQSYESAEVLDNIVQAYPDPLPDLFNIGLLHTSLSGKPGKSGYAPCELKHLLSKGYHYWALGHIHRYDVFHENPYVIFSGCIQGRHIREPGAKGCVRVDVNNSGQVSIERIILDVFRWKTLEVDITHLDTFQQVMDRTAREMEKVYSDESDGRSMGLRVVLHGNGAAHDQIVNDREALEAHIRRIGTDISRRKIWVEKIYTNTSPAVDLDELKKSKTPQGDLIRFIDELEHNPESFEQLEFSLEELGAKLSGKGVALPDLTDPEQRRQYLERARRMIIPLMS